MRVIVEERLARGDPRGRFRGQRGIIEIERSDLGVSGLELLEVLVVLLDFGVGEMVSGNLLGDLGLEVCAFVDELLVLLVPVGANRTIAFSPCALSSAADSSNTASRSSVLGSRHTPLCR